MCIRASLGGSFALPIEVNPFGLGATNIAIRKACEAIGLNADFVLRGGEGDPYLTDGGHYIIDASFGRIPDAKALSTALLEVPGVVQHGLFINLATACVIAGEQGIDVITR